MIENKDLLAPQVHFTAVQYEEADVQSQSSSADAWSVEAGQQTHSVTAFIF